MYFKLNRMITLSLLVTNLVNVMNLDKIELLFVLKEMIAVL